MNRYFCLVAISFLGFLSLSAQIEKGRYTLGGNVDISSSRQGTTSGFNMTVAPSFGIFVVKGFVIGARYSFGITSTRAFNNSQNEYRSVTTFTTGIGPQLKYYVGKKPVKGVFAANVNYMTSITLRKNDVSGTNGFSYLGSAGIGYFLNPHLSIESAFYVSGISYTKRLPVTRIGFSVGIFAFLDKKKKE